jgi:hypothetical protein
VAPKPYDTRQTNRNQPRVSDCTGVFSTKYEQNLNGNCGQTGTAAKSSANLNSGFDRTAKSILMVSAEISARKT